MGHFNNANDVIMSNNHQKVHNISVLRLIDDSRYLLFTLYILHFRLDESLH